MIFPPSARAARGTATVTKLLDAATAVLRDAGAAAVSIQHIADLAGTSKGLVHYHFADKDALLAACARHLTARLVADEAAALASSTPASVLGDLWASLSETGYRGRRYALLALQTTPTAHTRSVLSESSIRRRDAAERTIITLTELLHLDASLSRPALSLAFMSVIDGLILDASGPMAAPHRQAYDAFWLAVLSLSV